jgi:hypothetical protein
MRRLCPMLGPKPRRRCQNLATGCHPSAGAQQASKKRGTLELEPTARILPLSCYGSIASLIYRNGRKLIRW